MRAAMVPCENPIAAQLCAQFVVTMKFVNLTTLGKPISKVYAV